MSDFSDPGQRRPGQTADTLAALCVRNYQRKRRQPKQQPKRARKGRRIVCERGP